MPLASCLKGIIFNPINFAVFIFFFIWNDKSFICYISQHAMLFCLNSIGGVMVSVFASNAVDCGFESRSGQTKDYIIGICCFSAKHTVLRKKSKDWLARNQDNVCGWGDMSICGLLFHWASTIKFQLSMLV
jgi:hypothetical protein